MNMEYETIQAIAAFTGLIFFIVLFAVAIIYVARPSNRDKFSHAANAPLDASERPEQ